MAEVSTRPRDGLRGAAIIISTRQKKKKLVCDNVNVTADARDRRGGRYQFKIDPPDLLDQERCLDALAEQDYVKWFHSRALSRHSCTVVIRILRDLCLRGTQRGARSPVRPWTAGGEGANSAGCPTQETRSDEYSRGTGGRYPPARLPGLPGPLREGTDGRGPRLQQPGARGHHKQLPARTPHDRLHRQIIRCWASNRCRRLSGGVRASADGFSNGAEGEEAEEKKDKRRRKNKLLQCIHNLAV